MWDDALNQRQSDRRFQPQTSGGAQRAGAPGMGGGNIPYAPGSTQWSPSFSPPTQTNEPQSILPEGAGNGAMGAPGGDMGGETAPPPGGAGPPVNPYAIMAYASHLLNYFRNARGNQNRGYRGS